MMPPVEIVILAAGKSTRMRSSRPKVLHPVGGQPILQHIIATAQSLQPERVHVVIGECAEQVRSTLENIGISGIDWHIQQPQLGTGHAVSQALPAIDPAARLLILNGDIPLIGADSLRRLVCRSGDLVLLSATLEQPAGLGRIVRDQRQNIVAVVEEKDATAEQKNICEVNTNFICGQAARIAAWLARVECNNAQGEFYLTDIIAQAAADGVQIESVQPDCAAEILGVNDRVELARVERIWQRRQTERLMLAGVTLLDPARVEVRGACHFGQDCEVDVNVILEGENRIGAGCRIGANCLLHNVTLGDGCIIKANSILDRAVLGDGCEVGPFARLRPDTRLADRVRIGNFVEIKKSRIASDSKINHLSYIGDSVVGQRVNIGAGVITCNYDGADKHRTVIDDDVFVGSGTQLIAPLQIDAGATIGAGSTITDHVAGNSLAVARSRQRMIADWSRPAKATKPIT